MRNWDEIGRALPRIPETIVITGPVCSGKSTLATALARQLELNGRKVLIITNSEKFNLDNMTTYVGMGGVFIFDCVPPESISRNPMVRYITCGLIL